MTTRISGIWNHQDELGITAYLGRKCERLLKDVITQYYLSRLLKGEVDSVASHLGNHDIDENLRQFAELTRYALGDQEQADAVQLHGILHYESLLELIHNCAKIIPFDHKAKSDTPLPEEYAQYLKKIYSGVPDNAPDIGTYYPTKKEGGMKKYSEGVEQLVNSLRVNRVVDVGPSAKSEDKKARVARRKREVSMVQNYQRLKDIRSDRPDFTPYVRKFLFTVLREVITGVEKLSLGQCHYRVFKFQSANSKQNPRVKEWLKSNDIEQPAIKTFCSHTSHLSDVLFSEISQNLNLDTLRNQTSPQELEKLQMVGEDLASLVTDPESNPKSDGSAEEKADIVAWLLDQPDLGDDKEERLERLKKLSKTLSSINEKRNNALHFHYLSCEADTKKTRGKRVTEIRELYNCIFADRGMVEAVYNCMMPNEVCQTSIHLSSML